MRPRGEIRQALWSVYAEGGALSWREALPRVIAVEPTLNCRSGPMLVRRTVENMTRAGELVRCGEHKPPGAGFWSGIYELAERREAAPADVALDGLAAVTASWASFV